MFTSFLLCQSSHIVANKIYALIVLQETLCGFFSAGHTIAIFLQSRLQSQSLISWQLYRHLCRKMTRLTHKYVTHDDETFILFHLQIISRNFLKWSPKRFKQMQKLVALYNSVSFFNFNCHWLEFHFVFQESFSYKLAICKMESTLRVVKKLTLSSN